MGYINVNSKCYLECFVFLCVVLRNGSIVSEILCTQNILVHSTISNFTFQRVHRQTKMQSTVIFFCAAEYGEGCCIFDVSLFTDVYKGARKLDLLPSPGNNNIAPLALRGKATCCTSTPSSSHTPK